MEVIEMKKLKLIMFVFFIVLTFNAKAENKFETLCWNAITATTDYADSVKNKNGKANSIKLKMWINKNITYKPLKGYLKNKFLPVLTASKEFTSNNLYVYRDKYLNNCVAEIR
jgi:hypothetical protein|tara:strand:+ start:508 stop:846 length:339 start_codon:yes stop_codon:yes gene_type:complete